MKYDIYSIYDKKAMVYNLPFHSLNDATAQRIIADSLGPNSMLARHPADYALYRLGSFLDDTGEVHNNLPNVFVCEVLSLLPKSAQADLFNHQPQQVVKPVLDGALGEEHPF